MPNQASCSSSGEVRLRNLQSRGKSDFNADFCINIEIHRCRRWWEQKLNFYIEIFRCRHRWIADLILHIKTINLGKDQILILIFLWYQAFIGTNLSLTLILPWYSSFIYTDFSLVPILHWYQSFLGTDLTLVLIFPLIISFDVHRLDAGLWSRTTGTPSCGKFWKGCMSHHEAVSNQRSQLLSHTAVNQRSQLLSLRVLQGFEIFVVDKLWEDGGGESGFVGARPVPRLDIFFSHGVCHPLSAFASRGMMQTEIYPGNVF